MIDTVKLKVRINGEGSPLLLVPGGLTGWQSWEPFVDLFVRKKRKVIRVQLINVESAVEKNDLPKDYSLTTESHALAEMPEGHAPHLVSRERFLNELEIFHKEHEKTNV